MKSDVVRRAGGSQRFAHGRPWVSADGQPALDGEIERLHKSCRRLVWLNPLLRYDGFEPKAAGVRAMLPHVDEFRPVHNLESLAELARALADDAPRSVAA